MPLPGDDVVNDAVPAGAARHTRAVTINAPPEPVSPWLVQIGDRGAGFYSYDWLERATGTVHYVDGKHSAIRIRPELQSVRVGDWIATGSIGTRFRIDAPITRVEPGRAFLIGTWAFVLVPVPGGRTRLLLSQPYPGGFAWWCRPGWACYKCSAARSTTRLESAALRDGTEDDARPEAARRTRRHSGPGDSRNSS